MGNALEMRCGSCERWTAHPVASTSNGHFYWGEEHTPYFELILGEDLRYRRRDRVCSRCGNKMVTAELDSAVLEALIEDIDLLREVIAARDRGPTKKDQRYLPGVLALLSAIFGETPDDATVQSLSQQELAIAFDAVDAMLATLSRPESDAVRYVFCLWGAPTRAPVLEVRMGLLISRLRHPQRSGLLSPATDFLFSRDDAAAR